MENMIYIWQKSGHMTYPELNQQVSLCDYHADQHGQDKPVALTTAECIMCACDRRQLQNGRPC